MTHSEQWAEIATLISACEEAFLDVAIVDDEDVMSPSIGITAGMVRRARAAFASERNPLCRHERIEHLEDALRDILDVVDGWTQPLTRHKRLELIAAFAEAALSPGDQQEETNA